MALEWNAEIVDQIESHWRHQLRPRLEGLTDEEYFWQPVPGCWTISRRGTSAAQVSLGGGDFTWDFARSGDGEILFTSVEVIHHGAEVCLLRDLYRKDHW
jgi:hypothetical protein